MWGNGPLDSYPVLFPLKHLPMATVGWQATGLDGSLVFTRYGHSYVLNIPIQRGPTSLPACVGPLHCKFYSPCILQLQNLVLDISRASFKFQLISGEHEGNSRGSTDHVP